MAYKSLLLMLIISTLCSCSSQRSASNINRHILEVAAGNPTEKVSSPAYIKPPDVVHLSATTEEDNTVLPLQKKFTKAVVAEKAPALIAAKQESISAKSHKIQRINSDEPEDQPKVSVTAAASMILSLLSIFLTPVAPILGVPLIVCAFALAISSIKKINESDGKLKGKGMAVTGFIISGLFIIGFLSAFIVALWTLIFWW